MYVSWNGATEVRSWRLFGKEAGGGPGQTWQEVLVVPRSGPLPQFLHSVYVEALSSEGRVLGVTEAMETFVPSEVHDDCDDLWCNAMVMVDVEDSQQTIFSIGLDPNKWLYHTTLLYVALSFCLAAVALRCRLWRILCATCR